MSASLAVSRPGLRSGPWPERRVARPADAFDSFVQGIVGQSVEPELRSLKHFSARLAAIETSEQRLLSMDLVARNCELLKLRRSLQGRMLRERDVIQAFALIRVAVQQCLEIRLHDEQLYAGWCLLAGNFIEMQTGEGKTVTAALPAIVMGLADVPVHVISANEYLVSRDSRELESLYRWFGLSLGLVLGTHDDVKKRQAYACQICYCTHQQLVFDYLRDGCTVGQRRDSLAVHLRGLLQEEPAEPLQRGLCFAIIDEADSVLVDDARTPLILSESRPESGLALGEAAVALAIARELEEGEDYRLKPELRQVRLSQAGLCRIREHTTNLNGSWQFERYRQERISQALTALHLYHRDVDYLVQHDRVDLIDQTSGRATPQRRLQHGLHRLLEVKERCSLGDESSPIASLSYQRFFPRYQRLCGMSGTLHEARQELRQVYGPRMVRIPTVLPNQCRHLPSRLLVSREQQLDQLRGAVMRATGRGQAVLIGTRSVQLSEIVSQMLESHSIAHKVLNARQDEAEAQVIAEAGRTGQVTVATNMAGRGTDIKPDETALAAGGLHVISLEVNESRRVDRQLQGRAGRQGQPGSCQEILCMDDELLERESNVTSRRLMRYLMRGSIAVPSTLFSAYVRRAQQRVERRAREQRIQVARGQTQLQRILAIGGNHE